MDIESMGRPGLRVRPLLILKPDQLREAVDYLLQYERFVIDVETTMTGAHLNDVIWVGIGGPGRVFTIPISHPKGHLIEDAHYEMLLPAEENRKLLKSGEMSEARKKTLIPARFSAPPIQMYAGEVFELLRPLLFSGLTKVGHNLKFDLLSISKYYGGVIPPGPYDDTLLITHALDENRLQYDLKTLTMEWLRVPHPERKEFYPNLGKQGVENFSIDDASRYLAKDLRYTWLYCRSQRPRLAFQQLQEGYDLEMQLYPVLMNIERTGFPVDQAKFDEVGKQMKAEIAGLCMDVWKIAGYQFDLTNTTIKRDLLFKPKAQGGQGLKPIRMTPKTQVPQLNKEVLERYADDNELAALLLEWSALEKLNSTFITGLGSWLIRGKIHTNFKQHGTVTTRLSAQEPNLQQIPVRGRGTIIRELFVAEPGKTLVVVDYDQVELRCAAYLSQDPDMIKVFQEDQDIHSAAAAAMYQVPLESVNKDQRQNGKNQNFLTLFGGHAKKLARMAGVSVPQAEQFIALYYRQFKGLKKWKEDLIAEARRNGDRSEVNRKPPYVLIPPFGRRRRLHDLYSPFEYDRWRAERQAVNSVVQGFAAGIMKLALIDLEPVLLPYNAKMLCTVHDEIIVQCDTTIAEQVKDVVSTTMGGVSYRGNPILGTVPLQAKGNIGRSWADAK